MKLAWSLERGLKENLVSLGCDCRGGNSRVRVSGWAGMVSVQSRVRRNMAASPPALPGFGNSGKSFLIDNLLQSRAPSAPPAGGHLRLVACERPRRTWSSEHGAFQSQAQSPPQVKGLGGPLHPHSGGKHLFKNMHLALSTLIYSVFGQIMYVFLHHHLESY